MGIVRFALSGNYKRYMGDLKKLSKKNHKSACGMFIDTCFCTLFLKSGMQDYLNYKFYDKSWKERKTYVTIGSMAKAYKVLANVEYAPFFSNKLNFHQNFKEFTKRDYLDPEDSYENFEKFLDTHSEFVMKPQIGLGGTDVTKVKTKDIKDRKEFYEDVKKRKCFIEELVIQDKEWGKLSPDSVNTLRVMTGAVNGEAKLIFAAARIGSGKSVADNFHQGGRALLVDLEKGELVGPGFDKAMNEYDESVTGVKFDGFKIPYWEEIKEMVLKAALINDKVNIVGWDVAISKNGPLLIEGNRGPGFDIVQVTLQKGAKYMLDDLLDSVEKGKLNK